jgi:uncharacterized protein
MYKIASSLFSLLGISFLLSCKQSPTFETVANGKSLLWEISGNGLKTPSYFLGTMHLMCADDAVLSKNVTALIKQTHQVYLEVDMDNASELLGGMLDLFKDSDKSLEKVLNEYSRVKAFFEKHQPNLPFGTLAKQPPLMLSASLYELLLPCEQKNGVEMKIIDEAYNQKKETKGLETVAFQASIFDTIPYEEQARELLKSIDSLQKTKQQMDEMLKIYKQQDVEKLYTMSMEEDSSISTHADLMVYKRNNNWVEQFPTIATKNSTLFAVGAAHLGGEKGVLKLLRAKGYSVRAIKN